MSAPAASDRIARAVPTAPIQRGCRCGGSCTGCRDDRGEHVSVSRHSALLRLQRQAGNRAVATIVQRAAGEVGHEEDQVDHAVSGESSAGTVSVSGVTHARYRHQWDNGPITHQPAESCDGECSERHPCVTASAEKTGTYSVATNVSLPSANIEGLPECERGVLARWIQDVLAPHEQRHVAAYERYNGTTRKRFTATGCLNEVTGMLEEQMQSDHDTEESARRAACDQASAHLDPFEASIDFSSCEVEEEEEGGEESG